MVEQHGLYGGGGANHNSCQTQLELDYVRLFEVGVELGL